LARQAVLRQTGFPYHSILLDRTQKGKPFLVNCPPSCEQFNFNISHDGDYAVAAAELQHLVGVDIMQVDRPRMFAYTSHLKTCQMVRCHDNVNSFLWTFDNCDDQLNKYQQKACIKIVLVL